MSSLSFTDSNDSPVDSERGPSESVTPSRIRTDVWIVDDDGELTIVCRRFPHKKAARWAMEWAETDRQAGCLLWPSGVPLPVNLTKGGES
ncbi:MAG: hypothetical protein SGI77_00770 [Pirellulaceae bacterium]|nr:hypothetical protein [Pirellulaceae bacterium]